MLVTARILHVTQNWPERRYLDMSLLEPRIEETSKHRKQVIKAENQK